MAGRECKDDPSIADHSLLLRRVPAAWVVQDSVDLAPIATPADPHLARAARAVEESEVLAHRGEPTRVRTKPWVRGIKTQRPCPRGQPPSLKARVVTATITTRAFAYLASAKHSRGAAAKGSAHGGSPQPFTRLSGCILSARCPLQPGPLCGGPRHRRTPATAPRTSGPDRLLQRNYADSDPHRQLLAARTRLV